MKLLTIVALFGLLASCNGTADTHQETGDSSGALRPGVENVNGNMPSTENSLPLDTSDSTASADSINR